MLIMIAMAMMIVVLMYQQESHMDWISDGGHVDRAGSNHSDHCVMVHQILVSHVVGVLMETKAHCQTKKVTSKHTTITLQCP